MDGQALLIWQERIACRKCCCAINGSFERLVFPDREEGMKWVKDQEVDLS